MKNASKSHRILVETYGDDVPSLNTCINWFKRFKRGDSDTRSKERPGQPKRFQDDELQTCLDEDDSQSQQRLAEQLGVSQQAVSDRLHAMGKVRKVGRWVSK